MQFSLLSLGNFKSEFENEIFPDAVNFGQFATNRGNDFKSSGDSPEKLGENLKFKKLEENLKFKKLEENLKFKKLGDSGDFSAENFEIQKFSGAFS